MDRLYRLRVATEGAAQVEGNVAFTLGLSDLPGPPIVFSPIVDPRKGATEGRPFTVLAVDRGGNVTTSLTGSGRWKAIGRLCDVGYSDDNGFSWTEYGTGRIADIDESDGPGQYRIQVADESKRARSGQVFTKADTTRIFPAGFRADWREWEASDSDVASGSREDSRTGGRYLIQVRGQVPKGRGRAILNRVAKWVEEDAVDDYELGSTVSGGNFDSLRLRYDGADYEVLTFGQLNVPDDEEADLAASLRDVNPNITAVGNIAVVTFNVWIYSSTTPPAGGLTTPAYLYAPTGEPSPDLPLHIGVDDASHPWGTDGGGIHPGTLTRRVWDALGCVYDDPDLSAIEADSSFPLIFPRVDGIPDDPEKWMEENVWGPNMLCALRSGDGRRRLVDLRIPADVSPSSLPKLDASNARAATWRLIGRETVNSITWRYTRLSAPSADGEGDAALDGLVVEEKEVTPDYAEGDTIDAVGRHSLTLDHHGASPVKDWWKRLMPIWKGRGTSFLHATKPISRDLLDIFRDGAFRGQIQIGRSTAESLEEGDLVVLDCASLEIPNPATGDRTGSRIARLLGMERHPTHVVAELLDIGESETPLAAPTAAITNPSAGTVEVSISNLPAGASATVEVAYTDTSATPDTWIERTAGESDGTLTFDNAPGEGWAHVRVRSTAPGRIRSAWATDEIALSAEPQVRAIRLEVDPEQVATVYGVENGEVGGVRIRWGFFGSGDADNFDGSDDFAAGNLADGIELSALNPQAGPLTIEVEPWTGFSSGAVSGSAGPKRRDVSTIPTILPEGSAGASFDRDGKLRAITAGGENVRSWRVVGSTRQAPTVSDIEAATPVNGRNLDEDDFAALAAAYPGQRGWIGAIAYDQRDGKGTASRPMWAVDLYNPTGINTYRVPRDGVRASVAQYFDGELFRTMDANGIRYGHRVPANDGEDYVTTLTEGTDPNLITQSADATHTDWSLSTGLTATGGFGSVFPNEEAALLEEDGSGGFLNLSQFPGTFSGGNETVSAIVEGRDANLTSVAIYNQTTGSVLIEGEIDWGADTVTIVAGGGVLRYDKLLDEGPNGGAVYRVTLTASGTSGDDRRFLLYPTGRGTTQAAGVYFHHGQWAPEVVPSTPVLTSASSETREGDVIQEDAGFTLADVKEQGGATFYSKFVALGVSRQGTSANVWIVGHGDNLPIFGIRGTGSDGYIKGYYRHSDGSTTQPAIGNGNISYGDLVEVRMVLAKESGSWIVRPYWSINGGDEVQGVTATIGSSIADDWGQDLFTVGGGYNGNHQGHAGHIEHKFHKGVDHTLEDMRGLTEPDLLHWHTIPLRAGDVGDFWVQTDTGRVFRWNGNHWLNRAADVTSKHTSRDTEKVEGVTAKRVDRFSQGEQITSSDFTQRNDSNGNPTEAPFTFPEAFDNVPKVIPLGFGFITYNSSLSGDQSLEMQFRDITETGGVIRAVNRSALTTASENDNFDAGNTIETTSPGSSGDDHYEATSLDPGAAYNDAYTIHYRVEIEITMEVTGFTSANLTVALDSNDGSGWVERATYSYYHELSGQGFNTETWPHEKKTINVSGLGLGDQVRIRAKDFSFSGDGSANFSIHGFNEPTDGDPAPGVTYEVETGGTEESAVDTGSFVLYDAVEKS